ncbi:DNA polymerase ligase N-terminal domain-containing protein [Micromonospora sp. B11E3]|uniref:DNA polymerase ligase N-terminal domain-containing protein n=1 Tax=Micromonospora sp. B11E3 TaxID=3153562 RepID=UPI00325D1055
MADRLEEYRRRRDAKRTPEPVPERTPAPKRAGRRRPRFVIQQHHARRLHWDLRLEHEGVLASWAVPRGLPREPGRNHLAVHTEDHPMEYLTFHGEIPAGEYGGGRLRLLDDADADVTGAYPWLRELAEELAPTEAVLDGVLVDIDRRGRVRPARPGTGARAGTTGQYLVFDLLWLEGVPSVEVPYAQRRELLDGLALAGAHWQTPPWFPAAGADALRAGREQGLPGVVAKRLDSAYEPGRRSRNWLSIDAS